MWKRRMRMEPLHQPAYIRSISDARLLVRHLRTTCSRSFLVIMINCTPYQTSFHDTYNTQIFVHTDQMAVLLLLFAHCHSTGGSQYTCNKPNQARVDNSQVSPSYKGTPQIPPQTLPSCLPYPCPSQSPISTHNPPPSPPPHPIHKHPNSFQSP